MSVNVKKERHVSFVADNLLFKEINLRMQGLAWKYPLPVYVVS
jgi:hypothetical protein